MSTSSPSKQCVLLLASLSLGACSTTPDPGVPSYTVADQRYHPQGECAGQTERGIASWYGPRYHGKRTANGEIFDMSRLTAAHKTLPLPCYVRVTNLRNGRSLVVRVNDRGPFVDGRIIDLSFAAAARLGLRRTGTGPVEIQALGSPPPERVPR